jgi:hypothetical protein
MPAAALLCFALRCLVRIAAVVALVQHAGLLPAAEAQANLTTGAALTPPEYITSPSGDFRFGFRALDSDPTKFLLATWFRFGDSPPQPQSVVWFAKQSSTGSTVVATPQSVLSITAADGLVLISDGGTQVMWRAPTPNMVPGSVLALLDSGNLLLLDDSGKVLWESFSYPTDTLLPSQSLAPNSPTDGKLFSKRADAEFTTGRFSLAVQNDGNVVLYLDLLSGNNADNAYWASQSNSPNVSNTTVTFDDQGRLNYTLRDGTVHSLISPVVRSTVGDGEHLFQFARMDPDGIVRAYARPKNGGGNVSWIVSGAFPSDGCSKRTSKLQGMCGPGSYCVETTDRLNCVCPSMYSYTDAQHQDNGCTPEFEPQSCDGGGNRGSSEEFTLVELPNTTWETSIYYNKFLSVTEEQCRGYCLNDCFCAAALFIDGSDCAEVAALTNGRQGNSVTTKALIKVRTRDPWAKRRKSAMTYKAITVCLASLLVITVGGLLAWRYYHARNRNRARKQLLSSSSVRAFSWKELYQATNGFEKLLGKGSFGEVYMGTMTSPRPHLIAVKKLIDANEYSEQEFTNEVQSIGQIHHRYLVRMIGYCKQGKHRMLVFEFMPGGSLRSFLFNPEKKPPWRWRAEAALAIARGLEYLHDGCSTPVIHCDIKPDNILLDGHGIPRITDFGISKLLGSHQVHATVTHVRGTRGYIAPEWLRGDARVDTKADVYSFGVVLLEMICCRRCQEQVVPNSDLPAEGAGAGDETVTLFGWAAQLVQNRRTELMLLRHDEADAVEDMERVERFARVALWCIEPNPALRPTMRQVVHVLETSHVRVELPPDPPGCYVESS